jgi:ABC-2 type transport system ATP-binding protein
MEVISVENLHKSYRPPKIFARPQVALAGLSLEASEGEILGIVGPNGAGKTTFFRILMGLLRPDGGEGQVLGEPLGDVAARREVGYLPERLTFYPRLTVREMLEISAELCGLSRGDAKRAAGFWADRLGLGRVESSRLGSLSKGWLQRAGLAQAMVGNPRLLILDEPLSGLDPMGRAQVRRFVADLASEGRTVVLSSHILPDVEALAHRIALISDGRIVESKTLSEFFAEVPESVEIRIKLPDGESVDGARLLRREPDGWETWGLDGLGPGELESTLVQLVGAGASIRSISPRGRDLESLLLRRFEEPGRAA